MDYQNQKPYVGSVSFGPTGAGSLGSACLTKSVDPCGPTNSRIRDGVSYVETQVGELHHAISMLEERLDTILVPVPPNATSAGGGKESNGPSSHMFDRMGGLNNQVAEAKSRIHALLSRIEL